MEQGQTWMKPDLILEAGEFVLGVAVGIGICGLLSRASWGRLPPHRGRLRWSWQRARPTSSASGWRSGSSFSSGTWPL